jgi:hypothetical protein
MITNVGLLLIITGWGIQFFSKGKTINKHFVLVYSLGVILLVLDGFQQGLQIVAILNLISLVFTLVVYRKIRRY